METEQEDVFPARHAETQVSIIVSLITVVNASIC